MVYIVLCTAREAGEGQREQRVVSAEAGYLLRVASACWVYIYRELVGNVARMPIHQQQCWAAAEIFGGKMQVAVGRGSGR